LILSKLTANIRHNMLFSSKNNIFITYGSIVLLYTLFDAEKFSNFRNLHPNL
jgi:hypothetical protein